MKTEDKRKLGKKTRKEGKDFELRVRRERKGFCYFCKNKCDFVFCGPNCKTKYYYRLKHPKKIGHKDTSKYSEENRRRWSDPEYKKRVGKSISEGQKGRMPKGEEHPWWGRSHKEESKEKIRNSEYHKNFGRSGEKNYNWKGENIKYGSIHGWVKNNFKMPLSCEMCGSGDNKLEWSNKDHKYSRKREDWQAVCRSCHRNHDFENNR